MLSRPLASARSRLGGLVLCVLVAGCGGNRLEFTETKQIDEKVTEAELRAFLRVVRALPDERLPDMPPIFAPPPEWNQARTLPVGELVNEEENAITERWTTEWLARHFQKNRALARAVRREQMTVEQFAGLTLAVGAALARNFVPDTRNLDKSLQRGQASLARLRSDTRPFSSLPRDAQHHVLQQAAWVTRIDRIARMTQVPPENIALVRAHLDALQPIFPAEFNGNPLEAVVDRLEEQGLPFEETAESGSDADVEWDIHDADVGTDAPDEDFHKTERKSGTAASRVPAIH